MDITRRAGCLKKSLDKELVSYIYLNGRHLDDREQIRIIPLSLVIKPYKTCAVIIWHEWSVATMWIIAKVRDISRVSCRGCAC